MAPPQGWAQRCERWLHWRRPSGRAHRSLGCCLAAWSCGDIILQMLDDKYVYTYVYIYCILYICTYVCMYVCMYGCMDGCMLACMYACMYVYIYICIYIYINLCIYIYIYILTIPIAIQLVGRTSWLCKYDSGTWPPCACPSITKSMGLDPPQAWFSL